MTVTSTASSVSYQGNGATISFPFSFLIPTASAAIVTLTDTTQSPVTVTTLAAAQYGILGIGSPQGGTVTLTDPATGLPIAAGKTLTIRRVLPYRQDTSITNQGGFYPDVLEGALDTLAMQIQQVVESQSRAVTIPVGSGIASSDYLALTQSAQNLASQAQIDAQSAATTATARAAEATGAAAAAVKAAATATAVVSFSLDSDPALAAASDSRVATQKAVKTYVGTAIAGINATTLGLSDAATTTVAAIQAGVSVTGKVDKTGDTMTGQLNGTVFKSTGTAAATGFKIAAGTDLANIFARQLSLGGSLSGNLTNGVLTLAGGYCSYCTYCQFNACNVCAECGG